MRLIAGTKLGRYEIRSKIGEGGMGKAYLARDKKLEPRKSPSSYSQSNEAESPNPDLLS